MDKNKIKSFAIWARRKLILDVAGKANRIGISENNIENAEEVQGGFRVEGKEEVFQLSKNHRDALVRQVNEKGFEQVMEEVAYTWFNRFMGLRYMEVNEYLPTGVRILSSEVEDKVEPDVLTKVSEIIDELKLNAEEIYELLDAGLTEDREKAYRIILVKQCNELGRIVPQMFEKISDYTEFLLPDNLLQEGSIIRKMVEDIEEENWKEEVEIIGWMYQYYISEKKDEVFADLKKNIKITKENIPAATQLFTPKWIVKYMVENSLGRLWLEGHPNEELQKQWKYYLEEADQEPEVEVELKKIRAEYAMLTPEDIKVLDPCMGSGHILVYAFDVLYEIYKRAGYTEREIPRLILQNNLYGLDIDDRAAQLASFALIMKARHYNRRLFREIEREHIELNLCSIQESNSIYKEAIDYFCSLNTGLDNDDLENDLEYLWSTFTDAKEYGSILEVKEVNFEALKQRLKEIEKEENFMFGDYRRMLLDKLPIMIKQAEIMCSNYEICVTNPPYMGDMNLKLFAFVKKYYFNSKSDLATVFIERCVKLCKSNGYQAMITQNAFMFLSRYEKLRKKFLEKDIINMTHLGSRAFDEINGEVVQTTSFITRNNKINNYKAIYVKLLEYNSEKSKNDAFLTGGDRYVSSNEKFKKIPGTTMTYWANDNVIRIFESNRLDEFASPKVGMFTTDNNKYLKSWWELVKDKIGLDFKNKDEAYSSEYKWFPYNKGGGYRRWYGNNELVVNWANGGEEIRDLVIKKYPYLKGNYDFVLKTDNPYFEKGITWSGLTSGSNSFRLCKNGFLFDTNKGAMIFYKNLNLYYLTAFLNTKVAQLLINLLNSTISLQISDVCSIPTIISKDKSKIIIEIAKSNIIIGKNDWDSFETSWDFKIHPLLKSLDKAKDFKLSSSFKVWEDELDANFNQLKYNEEELNRIFIDIYGLQDELTPEVEEKNITIRKADREREIKSFISYAVGCMFGRYSADVSFVVEKKDGKFHGNYSDNIETLIYASGDFKDKWNLEEKKVRRIEKDENGIVISDSWTDAHFVPDADNVLPITEDEYFEDDIVSRFIDFVRLYFGAEDLEENLDFIADSIGRKSSETARQAIRRYFIKDFYKDHLKVYQKRPIYWMFESGKNDGFKSLVYMHRYNDQTVAKVRTDYLHTLQRKYEGAINRLQLVADSEEYTAKDRTAAKKKIDRISKQIEECREYDQVVAHLANEKISIDLDDGVKVNYAKFQDVKVINSKGKEVKMDLLSKI
ncbi:BREX-1 system adenine-specific DNA-methyltransferase PglX [Clostridium sp.]|uniref:BREX-1 system adenine-specific DNA-methyltransferase PglX n=1 Tax=Clostridium sp. TaxID=1506 RepID=UPI003216FE25